MSPEWVSAPDALTVFGTRVTVAAMIVDGVRAVRARIADACRRCGRPDEHVRLIAVTKGRSVEQVAEALAAGVTDIGENYVQEARAKQEALGSRLKAHNVDLQPPAFSLEQIRWHGIGHLQRNKARAALTCFDCIHTVDSVALADILQQQLDGAPGGSPQTREVLIQVNVSGEATKSGIGSSEAPALVDAVRRLPRLRLTGFMTIGPTPSALGVGARACFERLRVLRDAIDPTLTELSMGMTDDFEAAIAEGATMIRIGRALFEGARGKGQGAGDGAL